MDDEKMNMTILALYFHQMMMKDLFENHRGHVLVLDGEKAQLLASVILSGVFDEQILEEILGIPYSLFRQIRAHFLN